jgi:hypothetical protein
MSSFLSQPSLGADWGQHFLVGLLIVASFATRRFDKPPAAYTYTTSFWYWTGLVLYTAIPIGLYAILAGSLIASPVVLAVVVCAIVYVPPVSWVDGWWRPRVHRAIGAPTEARALAEALLNAEVHPTDSVLGEVRSVLARRGYHPDEPWLLIAEPIRKSWIKTAVLFHQVRQWEHARGYRAFVGSARSEFDGLRAHYDHLSLKVSRMLLTLDNLGTLIWRAPATPSLAGLATRPRAASDEMTREEECVRLIVADVLADVRQEISFYMRDLCVFIARGVLSTGATAGSRRGRLRALGFADLPRRTSVARVLTVTYAALILVFVGAMVWPALFPTLGPPESSVVGARVLLGVMIATMQLAAILVAVVPKGRYGFANEDLTGRTPRWFLVWAAAMAAALGWVIQLTFTQVISAEALPALHTADRYRWLLMPATTAGMIGFLIQYSRWSSIPRAAARRVRDAAVMAAANVGALLLVHAIGNTLDQALPLGVIVATVVGLMTGFVVPGACRQRFEAAPADGTQRRLPVMAPVIPAGERRVR